MYNNSVKVEEQNALLKQIYLKNQALIQQKLCSVWVVMFIENLFGFDHESRDELCCEDIWTTACELGRIYQSQNIVRVFFGFF